MRSFKSGMLVASGAAVTLAVVLILAVIGLVPVRVEKMVVQRTSAVTAVSDRAGIASTSAGTLTPSQIYRNYAAGVVEVISTFEMQAQSFFGLTSQSAQALGSGFVVSNDGYVLTNAHVLRDNGVTAKKVAVVFKDTSSDGATTRVTATVVGIDETSDVALLKVDPAKAPALDPLVLGDSSSVQVGEQVVAIGNPLGYDFSLTEGIVSATNRNLQSPNGSVISNGIQTDAAINQGNSGGPLIDSQGRVIGINEQIASSTGGSEGLGFAVPIDTAKTVMSQLKKSGEVTYAWLGVQGETLSPEVASSLGVSTDQGVLVADVVAGSPAGKAGIKGGPRQTMLQGQLYVTGGDVITRFDGTMLESTEELAAAVLAHKPGDVVTLTVIPSSGGSTHDVKVTLTARPAVS